LQCQTGSPYLQACVLQRQTLSDLLARRVYPCFITGSQVTTICVTAL
jgi:hypothetical protein